MKMRKPLDVTPDPVVTAPPTMEVDVLVRVFEGIRRICTVLEDETYQADPHTDELIGLLSVPLPTPDQRYRIRAIEREHGYRHGWNVLNQLIVDRLREWCTAMEQAIGMPSPSHQSKAV